MDQQWQWTHSPETVCCSSSIHSRVGSRSSTARPGRFNHLSADRIGPRHLPRRTGGNPGERLLLRVHARARGSTSRAEHGPVEALALCGLAHPPGA